MTEAEWLAADQPWQLAVHLHLHARESGTVLRRSRLLAVAGCRRIPANVMPADGPSLLDAIETWVDTGGRCPPVVTRLAKAVMAVADRLEHDARHSLHFGRVTDLVYRRCNAALAVAISAQPHRTPSDHHMILKCVETAARTHHRSRPALADAAALVRCVFGNPFRPVAFHSAWRTPTALAIAAGVYADRGFARLPVLADALEDAGCDAADLLAHLRGPGPHARDCWALDLVLGKT